MKNKKNKISNKIWFEAITIGLIFIILGFIVSYVTRGFNLLYIIGGVVLLACVNIPTSFTIDDNGMCVYYLFCFKKTEYFWHSIQSVYTAHQSGYGKFIEFRVNCSETKSFKSHSVRLSYNRRAKELIEKYSQKEIEDYTLSGDIKNLKNKIDQRNLKKQREQEKIVQQKLKKQNRHHKKK